LRRLALDRLEPTPENFARAYAEEAGEDAVMLPTRARAPLERLLVRLEDDEATRRLLLDELQQGRWHRLDELAERAGMQAAQRAQAWVALVERLVRGLELEGAQWSARRRRDGLQRVLDGSGRDLQRLQDRLSGLFGAWEADAPQPTDSPQSRAASRGEPDPDGASGGPAQRQDGSTSVPGPDTPAATAVAALDDTLRAALSGDEPVEIQLADRLSRHAAWLREGGPTRAWAMAVQATCDDIRPLLLHRKALGRQLGRLCDELLATLAQVGEEEQWTQASLAAAREGLGERPTLRGVRAAGRALHNARERHQATRQAQREAREALATLLQRLLQEVAELDQHTGRFEEAVGDHALRIERSRTLAEASDAVQSLLGQSRAVHEAVSLARQRLAAERQRAGELESRVQALEAELRRLAEEVSTDALTQLANRRGLEQAFASESARSQQPGAPGELAVALIDIDDFKRINDRLGHAAGDMALKSLAHQVRIRIRPQDHLSRFGGEEFVLLLPGCSADQAQQALTRLQRSLTESLFLHEGSEVFVTFSAGVTTWHPGEALEGTLERADIALYEAKRSGKNRACVA
jgi:diguanylate cyclase